MPHRLISVPAVVDDESKSRFIDPLLGRDLAGDPHQVPHEIAVAFLHL